MGATVPACPSVDPAVSTEPQVHEVVVGAGVELQDRLLQPDG